MDRTFWQEHLAETERHILDAEKRVAHQREVVEELERDGRQATAARSPLGAFVADRQRLRSELGL